MTNNPNKINHLLLKNLVEKWSTNLDPLHLGRDTIIIPASGQLARRAPPTPLSYHPAALHDERTGARLVFATFIVVARRCYRGAARLLAL